MTDDDMQKHDGTHMCFGRLWDASMSLRFGQCPYRAGAAAAREQVAPA